MKLTAENPLKYLSVKWPLWGAFLLGLLPVILQQGIDTQVIPVEYHAMLLSIVLPMLSYFGKKKYQPELHPNPTLLGFANMPSDSISFDEAFRRLIGYVLAAIPNFVPFKAPLPTTPPVQLPGSRLSLL